MAKPSVSPFVQRLNDSMSETAKHAGIRIEDCAFESNGQAPFIVKRIPKSLELFHYTTFSGAYGILENKCLWASDPLFLNDAREVRIGIDALDAAFSHVRECNGWDEELRLVRAHLTAIRDPDAQREFDGRLRQRAYSASFTEAADDLSQWRGYGNADGVALGFDLSLLQGAQPEGFIAPLLYGTLEEFTRLLVDDIRFVMQHVNIESSFDLNVFLVIRYTGLLPFLKDKAFEAEREWRYVLTDGQVFSSSAEWRTTVRFAVPFVKVALWPSGMQTPVAPGVACTQPTAPAYQKARAILGPGANPLAKHYFDSRLKGRYTMSEVPFRAT